MLIRSICVILYVLFVSSSRVFHLQQSHFYIITFLYLSSAKPSVRIRLTTQCVKKYWLNKATRLISGQLSPVHDSMNTSLYCSVLPPCGQHLQVHHCPVAVDVNYESCALAFYDTFNDSKIFPSWCTLRFTWSHDCHVQRHFNLYF